MEPNYALFYSYAIFQKGDEFQLFIYDYDEETLLDETFSTHALLMTRLKEISSIRMNAINNKKEKALKFIESGRFV